MAEFVLVPGAWLGGWVWKKVVPILVDQGHSAHPVTLTGMGERVHLASKEVGIESAIQDVLNLVKYTTSTTSSWWDTASQERSWPGWPTARRRG